jgi:uncharacterized metal-binding protein YceD (DUF177 family)
VSDLTSGRGHAFDLRPSPEAVAALRDELGVSGLRKLRFHGVLEPAGRRDWRLSAMLGATVVQPCVVTLAPVTTRIDEAVERLFLSEMPQPEPGPEVEMPEDDRAEPLGTEIDLGAVMLEALALALPDWPRAEGAELTQSAFTEPGKAPMSDEDARPFAELRALRDRLGGRKE